MVVDVLAERLDRGGCPIREGQNMRYGGVFLLVGDGPRDSGMAGDELTRLDDVVECATTDASGSLKRRGACKHTCTPSTVRWGWPTVHEEAAIRVIEAPD
jgi:hypothetical protein